MGRRSRNFTIKIVSTVFLFPVFFGAVGRPGRPSDQPVHHTERSYWQTSKFLKFTFEKIVGTSSSSVMQGPDQAGWQGHSIHFLYAFTQQENASLI